MYLNKILFYNLYLFFTYYKLFIKPKIYKTTKDLYPLYQNNIK